MEHGRQSQAGGQCSSHVAEVWNSLYIQSPYIQDIYLVSMNSCFENTYSVCSGMGVNEPISTATILSRNTRAMLEFIMNFTMNICHLTPLTADFKKYPKSFKWHDRVKLFLS